MLDSYLLIHCKFSLKCDYCSTSTQVKASDSIRWLTFDLGSFYGVHCIFYSLLQATPSHLFFSPLLLSSPGCFSSFLRDDIVFDRISSLLLSCSSSLSRPSTHVRIYIHASLSHFFGLYVACVCVCGGL